MIPIEYKVGDSDRRPWGHWVVLDVTPRLVVKKLVVELGRRISLQIHKFRSERWIVMQGVAHVQLGGEQFTMQMGDGVLIPQNTPHRLSNESEHPLLILEVQFGELLSENDIERLDDDYGREEQLI